MGAKKRIRRPLRFVRRLEWIRGLKLVCRRFSFAACGETASGPPLRAAV